MDKSNNPFVHSVFYLPGESLNIIMHDSALVSEGLRGVAFPFKFDSVIQRWVLDEENYPIISLDMNTNPVEGDVPKLMNWVSYWCQYPESMPVGIGVGFIALSPAEWCPLWYDYVWPRMD